MRKLPDCLTKTGKFLFCPAENFSLSYKCPATLRKSEILIQTLILCFVTFKQVSLISWLMG